jgi:hypothetical protein
MEMVARMNDPVVFEDWEAALKAKAPPAFSGNP